MGSGGSNAPRGSNVKRTSPRETVTSTKSAAPRTGTLYFMTSIFEICDRLNH